jgi:hypothetical protein
MHFGCTETKVTHWMLGRTDKTNLLGKLKSFKSGSRRHVTAMEMDIAAAAIIIIH